MLPCLFPVCGLLFLLVWLSGGAAEVVSLLVTCRVPRGVNVICSG